MGSADPRAGQHRHDDLGDHRQVDADHVSLADAAVAQRVGEALRVGQQLGVGDLALLALLAAPVKGDAIAATGLDVAVKAVRWCDPSWLARHLQHNSLIMSDCEGYEGALFCEQWVPAFASCTFVIELHEAFVPGVTERCRAMFADTHAAQIVDTRGAMPRRARRRHSQTMRCDAYRRRRADLSSGSCSRRCRSGSAR